VKVVVISGPTASGKTSTSLNLADKFGGEIVNFDSLLLYKEISIGTAKPTMDEQKNIPHHMIDVASISHPLNAARYAEEASKVIQEIHNRNKIPYLVGGSGFYLQAVLKGMYNSPTTPEHVLKKSEDLYMSEGIAPFLSVLKQNDPISLTLYHENDHYRVRRAVEHWWTHQTPFSSERGKKDEANETIESSIHDWDVHHLHLDLPKEEHLRIIIKRTRTMLEAGLEQEVRALLSRGFSGLEKPLQSIGYKEILDYIFGVYKKLDECEERIVISTRQLAKSQRTWFKKDLTKIVFHPIHQKKEIELSLEEFLKKS
jgi:tRNA dimethylallyltransferase